MGWFWGNSSENSTNNENDPTKQLDPGLRDYLDKEAPAEYTPTKATSAPPPRPSYRDQVEQSGSANPGQEAAPDGGQAAPSASLFPDGRYAYLWKNYQPIEEIEGPSKTAAEKVVDQFKDRKNQVHKAALENCSDEHLTLTNCFKLGDFSNKVRARVTMCQLENSIFSRCYVMQGIAQKFLVALGYGSGSSEDEGKQEQIQMHADKLYHQMIDYEARVAEAKTAGIEPPPPKSLFNPGYKAPEPSAEDGELEAPGGVKIPPKLQKSFKDLTPHEREVEMWTIKQRMTQQASYAEELAPMFQAQAEGKEKRREKFSKWFGPTIGKWLT